MLITKEERNYINNTLTKLKEKIVEDDRIESLDILVDNAIKLSEYCIDRLKLTDVQRVADCYLFVNKEYLELSLAHIKLIDEDYKSQGQRVAKWSIYRIDEVAMRGYYHDWFVTKK